MAELLLELSCEEIPARMQARAAEDLARLVGEGLRSAGLNFASSRSFATPRRLTLVLEGLPERSADSVLERNGPRVGAPDKAVEGFLRAAGLRALDQAEIVADSKKGDYYVARVETPGRPAADLVTDLVPDVIRRFPWPKSMRWGDGSLRWVRPLHAILCLLDGKTVPIAVDGVASGGETRGHRFMAPAPFAATGFADYEAKLRSAKVMLDPAERRESILEGARKLAAEHGLVPVEDEALLAENAGLTEWPVVLLGRFDEAYLDVPPEVLATSMKTHQKCFSLRDGVGGRLANRFLMVANLEARDGGTAIVAGNERVIDARLADAKFFWDQDRKVALEARVEKLNDIVFHDQLGTQYERVHRLRRLARALAAAVGADADEAERAAILAKADLVTGMVGEFPELQGLMGRYYALEEGELPEVADALADHYKPQGPSDAVPTHPVSVAVALADKLDQLVGFWAIGETPTGSKDPYALRRAALGVIRIVLENGLRISMRDALCEAWLWVENDRFFSKRNELREIIDQIFSKRLAFDERSLTAWAKQDETVSKRQAMLESFERMEAIRVDLLTFFADRLKVHLREQGARHDLIDAVFSLGGQDDILMIVRRVEALGRFLETEDGANLLTGVKRAANILAIEEKRDGRAYDGSPDPSQFRDEEERALAAAIERAEREAAQAVAREDFASAMSALAALRAPVDAFFDHVTVNIEDAPLRANRLTLLNRIRAATRAVADFSRIAG